MALRPSVEVVDGPFSVDKSSDPQDGRPWKVWYGGRVVLTAIQEWYARSSCSLFNQMWKDKNR